MSGIYTPGLPQIGSTSYPLPFTGNETIGYDTNLVQGQNPETAKASLAQLSAYFGGTVPLVTGRFYGIPTSASLTTVLTATGVLYAYPYYVSSAVTLKSLNLSVTTGQTGGAAHIGLYADNGLGYPGALIAGSDGGALAATATAVVTNSFTTITLAPGIYWLASIFTATSTFPTVEGLSAVYTNDIASQLGYTTATAALAGSATAATGIQVTGSTYGTLASTFPAGAVLTVNATTPAISIGV